MRKWLSILAVCMFLPQVSGALELARGGKTEYKIVYASDDEKEAADELKLHLDQITGAVFPVEKESPSVSGPAIWLGDTAFARKRGLESSKLA